MTPRALLQAWKGRPLRERLLIGAVALAALLALVDALWTAPMEKRLKRVQGETASLQDKLKAAQAPTTRDGLTPDQRREQEAQLRQRLQVAQAAQAELRQRVADAARLPETLRAITATVGSAKLLELSLAGDAEPPAGAASAAARRLYRLPISLKVSGSYDELQLLLTQIERHAEALQWQSVALDSTEWPAIQLTLKAHVLSLDPRWGAS
ncbi:MAG: biosis protein MshJ [Pseudomonadota bacterium]|jgi:Tfp pilus assembly protein PilO